MTADAVVPTPRKPRATHAERHTLRQQWEEKTFKREIAVLGLGVWLVMTILAVTAFLVFPLFTNIDAARLTAMGTAFGNVYTIATTMIFVFAGTAFGIDAYAKQIK